MPTTGQYGNETVVNISKINKSNCVKEILIGLSPKTKFSLLLTWLLNKSKSVTSVSFAMSILWILEIWKKFKSKNQTLTQLKSTCWLNCFVNTSITSLVLKIGSKLKQSAHVVAKTLESTMRTKHGTSITRKESDFNEPVMFSDLNLNQYDSWHWKIQENSGRI